MNCPRCQGPLRNFEDVHVCVSCGGAFLAATATDTVRRALDPEAQDVAALAAQHAAAAATSLDKAAPCPVCRGTMRRFRVGPVDVDTCLEHGTWYDRGELARVKQALEERLPTEEVPVEASIDAPPPAVAATLREAPSLELARDPRDRKPPPPQMTRGGVIDPGVQQKINDLARHEQWEEERRRENWRRWNRHSRRHDHDGLIGALDLVTDVLRFLR